MADPIATDWINTFPLTERNQIVGLLEELAIAAGGEVDDTITTLQLQDLLAAASGQIVITPTIPPTP